jgi:outer membrane protein TolC
MKKQLFWSFLFIGVTSVQSQTLDLETCIKMADTANLTIRAARLDAASNAAQVQANLSALLPKIAFNADYRYNAIIPGQVVPGVFAGGPPGSFTTVQFGVPWNLSNTVQLSQILYNPQVNYGVTALKIGQEVSEIQASITTQNIKYQVIQTYFNIQALWKQVLFVRVNIQNMEKTISNLTKLYEQKMVVGTEVDKLKITLLSLKNQEQSLISNQEKSMNYLKILIGKDIQFDLQLPKDNVVEKSINSTDKSTNLLELKLIETQQRLNTAEKSGIQLSYLPSFSFYTAYNYNYNIRPASDFKTGIEGMFMGIKVDWMLFDGFEKHHKLKVNRIQQEKLASQHKNAYQQIELAIENSKKQIEIQFNSLNTTQEQLLLAEKVNRQAKISFEQGVISSNDLLKSETDLYQAQTNVIMAYVQLRQAELDLLKTTGKIN